tara:strand:- start:1061 stop:1975 length:915 start_codon:yes stop_codon:yes gene_type:complete
MGLDVSALSDFNNEVAGELITKMVYGGSTMEYITIKEGVKFQEPINLMEVDLVLQNGTCVSTPSGSLDFSQRNITVCPRTSFDGICLKDMDRTYLGISALERGSYNETFALATNYSELLVNQFQKKNDQFLWSAISGSNPAGCASDGLVKIISGSTTGVVSAGTGDATLANLETMLAALSSDVADRDDLTYFMSVSKFRSLIADIRTQNNFYFDPVSISNRGGILEIGMPFQNAKIVGTVGLQGSNRIVLGPAKQIVAGTDLMSDFSEFQLWYDINSDQLKHRISTKLGVNVAYPEFWVSNDVA